MPTDTPTVAPTATFTPTPSPSPTVLKTTPATRATARPVTKVAATAAPAAASAAAIPAGTPLREAVHTTFENAQGLLGVFNTALAGGKAYCETIDAYYQTILTAPTYDVSQQSADTQTAYGLYREGIDVAKSGASIMLRLCDKGGFGDKSDLLAGQKSAGDAVALLGRAFGLLPGAPLPTRAAPTLRPTPTANAQLPPLSDFLMKTIEQMQAVGGLLSEMEKVHS